MKRSVRVDLLAKVVRELFKTHFGISICIHSAYDCKHLLLDQIVAKTAEEFLQVRKVDEALLVFVNSPEGCVNCEVTPLLQSLRQ